MSKIEDAIDNYVQEQVDSAVSAIDWNDIVRDTVDFEDLIKDNVDFGDLARDAMIENVADVLNDNLPEALRDFDLKGLIVEKVDFAELLQQNIDWSETAKDAIETEMTRQFHDLERAIDEKVTRATGTQEDAIESLKGEIAMLKLEVEKLKHPLPWYRRWFR